MLLYAVAVEERAARALGIALWWWGMAVALWNGSTVVLLLLPAAMRLAWGS